MILHVIRNLILLFMGVTLGVTLNFYGRSIEDMVYVSVGASILMVVIPLTFLLILYMMSNDFRGNPKYVRVTTNERIDYSYSVRWRCNYE